MTTLELFRKHRKGEVSRDRFLYEVRRDSNLPWVTNTTSYDDAVKILKNKGIIREAQFESQNITTDPLVDRVNPYALKREVEKLLSKEKVLTNDSYKEALNKAAKKLTTPDAVKKAMFANADSVAKADAKLQTQEVKKANHKDKHNEMKKTKGQMAPKATSAPTKENKKTKKPKGVEVMKDKGVEGTEKIIKEISSYIKKKLTENSSYHDYHEGMEVETQHGPSVVKEINGGTLTVETKDGKLYDVQMNHAKHFSEKKYEEQPKQEEIDIRNIGGREAGMQLADKLIDAINTYNDLDPEQKQAEIERLKTDIPAELKAKFDELMDALHDESNYPAQEEDPNLKEYFSSDFMGNWSTITVSLRDAARAIELFRDASFDNYLRTKVIEMYGTNSYIVKDPDVAVDLYDLFNENGIEIISAQFPEKEDDELDEARDINDPALVSARARIQRYKDNPQMSLAQVLNQRDRDFEVEQEIKALKRELRQTLIDMEQEAEPEGGPIADDYADRIMDLQDQIKALEAQLREEDLDERQALVVPSSATGDQIDKLAKANPSIKPGQQIDIIRK